MNAVAELTEAQIERIAQRLDQLNAHPAAVTTNASRRATYEAMQAAEREWIKFRDRVSAKRAGADAEVAAKQKALGLAVEAREAMSWGEAEERAKITGPLNALRQELERSAPPQIDTAIQGLYVRIGEAGSYLRAETVAVDFDGKIRTTVVNGPEVAAYERACRHAIERLELLRAKWSPDVDREIAGILNTIRAPK